MKLRPHHSPWLGLLLLSPSALAVTLSNPATDPAASIAPRAEDPSSPLQRRISTDDAPVDGKDGKPHQGPFVETIEKDGQEKSLSSSSPEDEPVAIDGKPADTTVDEYGNKLPESNDGVMDDKERSKAKEGTTGTEGGVSERERQRKAEEARTGEKSEGSPISPEEKPPLPHSEVEKMKAKGIPVKGGDGEVEMENSQETSQENSKEKASQDVLGLEKPDDLPQVPHDTDHPIPGSAVKGHLDIDSGSHSAGSKEPLPGDAGDAGDAGIIQPFHSFVLSFAMIIFSEIGDKTFLVAALMAMKHDRMVVFSAAFSALIAMTVLSAVLGHAVPALIPKSLTNFAAAVLFLVFGAKLLREGLAMDPNDGVAEEMHEVEREISEKESEARRNGNASAYAMEAGYARKPRSKSRLNSPPRSPSSSPEGRLGGARTTRGRSGLKGAMDGIHNLTSLLLSPAWVQTFVMTFLGEWGDRSQIATIAMAAGQDYWWVILGAVLGHMCCTGVAVIGGRAIAGKVSMKVVTVGGAVAFLVFGLIYLVEGFYG